MGDIWDSADTKKWLELCQLEQQEFHDLLGTHKYTKYKPCDYNNLKRNIGFALFDAPGEEPSDKNENTGYDKKQCKLINKVFKLMKELTKKCCKDKKTILVAFIFVSIKIKDCLVRIPVFRVAKTDDSSLDAFIDSTPRLYDNWEDYLKHNKLPDCLMCYPTNGTYISAFGKVQLDRCISPAGRIGNKVLKGLDITSTVIQFAGAGVGIASLFVPMAWPVILGIVCVNGVTGAYASGRSIAALRDRDVHGQGIGLNSPESRNCYLGIVGSFVGVLSGGVVTAAAKTAQAGKAITLASQIALKGLTSTSCVINGLGVANGVANIAQKAANKEEITSLDMFQLTSSILFFTSSVISVRQAYLLMNDMGDDGIDTRFLNKISKFSGRTTRSMSDVGELSIWNGFAGAVSVPSMSMSSPSIRETLFNVCQLIFDKLVEMTKQLWKKVISSTEYRKEIADYLQRLWNSWEDEMVHVINKVCERFGIERRFKRIEGGKSFLDGKDSGCLNEIANTVVMQKKEFENTMGRPQINSGDRAANLSRPSKEETEMTEVFEDAVLSISKQFADIQACKDAGDFIKYLKFACTFVRKEFETQKDNYEKTLEVVKTFSPDVKPADFDKTYGISDGNKNGHFLNKVLNQFKNKDGFFQLKLAYDIKNDVYDTTEEADENSFKLNDGVTIDTFSNKVGRAKNGKLSRNQYYEIASQMMKKTVNEDNVSLEVDSGTAIMCVNDSKITIIVKTCQVEGKVCGIVVMVRDD